MRTIALIAAVAFSTSAMAIVPHWNPNPQTGSAVGFGLGVSAHGVDIACDKAEDKAYDKALRRADRDCGGFAIELGSMTDVLYDLEVGHPDSPVGMATCAIEVDVLYVCP